MADLNVPDRYVSAFETLAGLGPGVVDALIAEIESLPLFCSSTQIERAISRVGEVGDPELMTGAIAGAMSVIQDQTPEGIRDAAIDLSESPKLDLPEDQRKNLAEILERLLGLRQVATSTKAESMLFESERLYLSSRIVSDIRPVFGTDIDAAPEGALLRHMVRINYLNDQGDREAFFVALDSIDLEELEESIGRALQKAEAIKGLLAASEIPLFEAGEEEDD